MNPSQLLLLLRSRRILFATVESCTGGMIADQITDIAGASDVFWGSWVVYDSSAKIALGVPAQILDEHGAVSAETAQSLAESGLKQFSKALQKSGPEKIAVVSTTGIAGPTGGTPEKPVGLCYVGVSIASVASGAPIVTKTLEIQAPAGHSRIEYKTYFTEKAIEFLVESLRE